MFCSNCGAQVPDGTKFCPNCGAQIAQAGPAQTEPAQSQPQQQYSQPQQGQYQQQGQYNQQGQFNQQAQFNQQQGQYNQQGQFNQQAQWNQQQAQYGQPQAAPGKVKASGGGLFKKLAIGIVAAVVIVFGAAYVIGSMSDPDPGYQTVSGGGGQPALPDPSGVISLEDFDWFYHSSKYDRSGDIPVTEAYSPSGVWKVTIMRKPNKKSSYRMELYLLDLTVEGRPRVIGSEQGAAEVYGYQGFLKSDEAKEAGLDPNSTAGDLISALQEGDGTLPCTGTLILLLQEDENGNMVQPKKQDFIDVAGKYSPKHAILQLEDKDGNRYGTHAFVKSGNEEHCEGAYTAKKGDPVLGGMIGMCRDCE